MKKLIISASMFFLLSSPASLLAAVADIPRTGQTTSYAAGDDGNLKAGVPWPGSRFTVSGDCVTDNLTGLMWAKNGNLPGGQLAWQASLNYIATTVNSGGGLCGYTDWRLPNAREMESLLNVEENSSAAWLNSQGFANVQTGEMFIIGAYWSSTTGAEYLNRAESVYMTGTVGSHTFKTDPLYMWPVRNSGSGGAIHLPKTGQTAKYSAGDDGDLETGVAWPDPRFSVSGDCVTDNLTGLMWTKDANLMKTKDPGFDADGAAGNGAVTWSHALDYVAMLNSGAGYCGHTDWRLPNRRELWSMVDYSKKSPPLPVSHPFTNVVISYYWSSTTAKSYNPPNDYAWGLNMAYGFLGAHDKTGNLYVWPVRSGQVSTPRTMNVHFSGTGSGTVSGNGTLDGEPVIFSFTSDESEQFDNNSLVSLHAAPSEFSLFSRWEGNCSGTNVNCNLTMNAGKSVTAVFDFFTAHKTRVGDTSIYHSTLQASYNAAPNPGLVKAWATDFVENLSCDRTKDVLLEGGYNGGYSSVIGYTTLKGRLSILNGSLTVENLVIQ